MDKKGGALPSLTQGRLETARSLAHKERLCVGRGHPQQANRPGCRQMNTNEKDWPMFDGKFESYSIHSLRRSGGHLRQTNYSMAQNNLVAKSLRV